MVNSPSPTEAAERPERRERPRGAEHAPALGVTNPNPFGDLHTVQHLSARLARSLRGVFEPLVRRAVRCWAEPVEVDRFAAYVASRGGTLAAWVPMTMTPGAGQALLVIDGRFTLEALDLFFGGFGDTPSALPNEFSPAAEALVRRIATAVAGQAAQAWQAVTPIRFEPGNVEANAAMLAAVDGEDAVIVTRFGLASEGREPVFVDILYPVNALKPHGPALNAKVHGRSAEPDPKWRNGLTRAAMGLRIQVRSVLAEPVVSLARLLELKEGDVIPISFGPDVPVMVANRRLGVGTVGTANGQAAIRLTQIDLGHEEDFQ